MSNRFSFVNLTISPEDIIASFPKVIFTELIFLMNKLRLPMDSHQIPGSYNSLVGV